MPISLNTNIAANLIQQNLNAVQTRMTTSYQRLSSGLRVNSPADDPGAYSMATNFSAQASSWAVAERNASSGIALTQAGSEVLGNVVTLIQRMRDLATQSQNTSLTTTERTALNTEFIALRSEIDRLADNTTYNTSYLLNGGGSSSMGFQVGIGTNSSDRVTINLSGIDVNWAAISSGTVTIETTANASTAVTQLDNAMLTVNNHRTTFAATTERLTSALATIQSMRTTLTNATSKLRDVDIAEETANLTRYQVLAQAGASLIAQANQNAALALTLFQ